MSISVAKSAGENVATELRPKISLSQCPSWRSPHTFHSKGMWRTRRAGIHVQTERWRLEEIPPSWKFHPVQLLAWSGVIRAAEAPSCRPGSPVPEHQRLSKRLLVAEWSR